MSIIDIPTRTYWDEALYEVFALTNMQLPITMDTPDVAIHHILLSLEDLLCDIPNPNIASISVTYPGEGNMQFKVEFLNTTPGQAYITCSTYTARAMIIVNYNKED